MLPDAQSIARTALRVKNHVDRAAAPELLERTHLLAPKGPPLIPAPLSLGVSLLLS